MGKSAKVLGIERWAKPNWPMKPGQPVGLLLDCKPEDIKRGDIVKVVKNDCCQKVDNEEVVQ